MERTEAATTIDDNDKGVPAIWNRKAKKLNDSELEDQDTPTSSSRMLNMEKVEPNRTTGSQSNTENDPTNSDLILKNIFEFSSVNELKNCRLVCKRWQDLSLSSWRGKAVLRTERMFAKPAEGVEYDTNVAVEEFSKNASKCVDKPFQRYDMNFDGMLVGRVSLAFEIKNKKMMLSLFSSSIRDLSLRCDDWNMILLVLTTLPELRTLHLQFDCSALYRPLVVSIKEKRKCPLEDLQEPALATSSKLLELELTVYKSHVVELPTRITFPWKKIFQNVPALKTLRVNIFQGQPMFEDILRVVCELRNERNFSILNLEELHVSYPIHLMSPRRDRLAKRILESQLPLQTLRFDLGDEVSNNTCTFSDLLNGHADTLHFIECGIAPPNELPSLPLAPYFDSKVKLPKLKELVLISDCVSAFHMLSSLDVSNLEILEMKMRPKTSIHLQPDGQEDIIRELLESDYLMGSCFLPNLKKFFIDHFALIDFTVADLKCLGKAMPSLTDLRISLGEGTFPIVYELWPDLQSLHVVANAKTYSLLDDCAISGFPVLMNLSTQSRKSNITQLKHLRRFVLETKSDSFLSLRRPRQPFISDLSALLGFLELPMLDILEIESICQFSPNIMTALESHISEIKIREPDIFRMMGLGGS